MLSGDRTSYPVEQKSNRAAFSQPSEKSGSSAGGSRQIGLARLVEETTRLEVAIAQATSALAALADEQHRQEMALVAFEAQAGHARGEAERLGRKAGVIALERRQAEEERASIEARYAEAEASIARLFEDQRRAEAGLSEAQGRLMTARETIDALSASAAEARAAHAAMTERASALVAERARLEEIARDIEGRVAARARSSSRCARSARH